MKDPAKIVCFKCKIEGHHVRSCPLKKKPHGEKKQGKRPQDGAHGLPRLEERPLPKKDQAKAPVVEKSSEKKEKRRTCYICREKGHISSFCTSGSYFCTKLPEDRRPNEWGHEAARGGRRARPRPRRPTPGPRVAPALTLRLLKASVAKPRTESHDTENLETPPPRIPSRGFEIAPHPPERGFISRRTLHRHGRLRSDE
ncbi:hypothetical protein QYE76_017672 [Lolium multiflorum]|uniref:CCHC-type domain-containing protein n=1 Tax=Lolium multiflorum TaxID=4521 RepID=A0AAD8PV04_LOLMU|nr:hypothetical protein QYE76_017672 [Lolium multiflorum]